MAKGCRQLERQPTCAYASHQSQRTRRTMISGNDIMRRQDNDALCILKSFTRKRGAARTCEHGKNHDFISFIILWVYQEFQGVLVLICQRLIVYLSCYFCTFMLINCSFVTCCFRSCRQASCPRPCRISCHPYRQRHPRDRLRGAPWGEP